MRKLSQQPLPAPTASTVGPCPIIILIRRSWKLASTIVRKQKEVSLPEIRKQVEKDKYETT